MLKVPWDRMIILLKDTNVPFESVCFALHWLTQADRAENLQDSGINTTRAMQHSTDLSCSGRNQKVRFKLCISLTDDSVAEWNYSISTNLGITERIIDGMANNLPLCQQLILGKAWSAASCFSIKIICWRILLCSKKKFIKENGLKILKGMKRNLVRGSEKIK